MSRLKALVRVRTSVTEVYFSVDGVVHGSAWLSYVSGRKHSVRSSQSLPLTETARRGKRLVISESSENRGSPTGPARSQDRRRGPANTVHRDSPKRFKLTDSVS